jgi:glycosyltransferase involved in cell wall biosynthesis
MSIEISVIIPAYNAETFLHQAIEAALKQTVMPVEILVVDDGSKDGTRSVAESYGPPVHYLHRANGGPAAARNTGLQAARGEWLAFLDADDFWPENYLESQIQTALQTEADLVFTDARVVSPSKEWPSWFQRSGHAWIHGMKQPSFHDAFNRLLRRGSFALPSAVMMKREHVVAAGGFDERLPPGLEDFDLWLRIASRTQWALNSRARIFRSEHDSNLTANRFGMAVGREKLWLKMMRRPPCTVDRDQMRIMQLRLAESQWEQAYWGLRNGQRAVARNAARNSLRNRWRGRTALYWFLAGLPCALTSALFRLRHE